MRQKIVVELEGEAPAAEEVAEAVREAAVREAGNYHIVELWDFSVSRMLLPEKESAEIQVPGFLKDWEAFRRENASVLSGKGAVQDG